MAHDHMVPVERVVFGSHDPARSRGVASCSLADGEVYAVVKAASADDGVVSPARRKRWRDQCALGRSARFGEA
ncbi:MAG: hypothetical protein ACI9MC_002497, partial [Kiritimatiellia bacterium]